MKTWKKLVTMFFAVTLLLCLSCGSAFAAGEPEYTYTVTFRAGAQGSFTGTDGLVVTAADDSALSIAQTGDKIVVSGLAAGDEVAFNAQACVAMSSEKHYVQGIRLSGHDNNTVSASAFTVNADADYVVAYGIKGNLTNYTVHYQDDAGNTLAESDVYYGNVGDKPVVAYKYIEGYEPQVIGFTKTLDENEAENVFVFVYDEIVVEDIIQQVPGGTGGGTGTATPDDNTADDQAGEDDAVPGTDESDDAVPENQIVDLDDEETPLGNMTLDEDGIGASKAAPLVGMIAMVVAALAALAGVVFFASKKSKR